VIVTSLLTLVQLLGNVKISENTPKMFMLTIKLILMMLLIQLMPLKVNTSVFYYNIVIKLLMVLLNIVNLKFAFSKLKTNGELIIVHGIQLPLNKDVSHVKIGVIMKMS
jgi:hypothetical protein